MQLFHPALKDLLLIDRYCSEDKVEFLSIETELPDWFKNLTTSIPVYAIGLNIRREYRHIAMGLRALKLKQCDVLFVFEAYNQHLFVLLLLLTITRKKVLIMMHGNQQLAMESKLKYLGLLYFKMYLKIFKNFKAILLEIDDDVLPSKFRLPSSSTIIIPHPSISKVTPRLKPGERLSADRKIKIGVVGTIRQDKPIAKLITKLQEYVTSHSHCELIIGTPFSQKPNYLDKLGVKLYDTTREEDYFELLKKIDIIAIDYEKNRYYYRASGVAIDAACCGCYVIASDYPVIKHQVNSPIEVGNTFSNLDELESKLDRAIVHIKEKGQDNHWIWQFGRSAQQIAKILTPQ
ncbi:MAG: glycosyltransferase family 1 protein [Xenococcaceae cyanobacterium]